MSRIITVGNAKYEILEETDKTMKLRSLYSGIIRDAEKMFLKFGFCTRQEYLCGFLLYEVVHGFDSDFVCVPTHLWWTDIIDMTINDSIVLRLVTSKNWRTYLLGLQELQRIFGRVEKVTQISDNCWNVVCGGIHIRYNPYLLSKEDMPISQAIKLESISDCGLRIINEEPVEKFGVTIKLCFSSDSAILGVRIDNDILLLTDEEWRNLIEFVYFHRGRKFYDGGKIYYYEDGKLLAYKCKEGNNA